MRKISETQNEVAISAQTPIEIALQIDENGMTTASKLYEFLGLHPAHFSRWCRKNIVNNKFATENEDYIVFTPDYIVFTLDGENPILGGGRPKFDYRLTSDFAKKLSMTGNTERHEEARKYFIACEQGLKAAMSRKEKQINSADEKIVEMLSSTLSAINDRLSKIEESQAKKQLPQKIYSRWKTKTFGKLNLLLSYVNENADETLRLSEIIHLVIEETEDIYGIELNDYVDAYKSEFELSENPYAIDVLNYYKDIREMFTGTLDYTLEKLHIAVPGNKAQSRNIFDELAEKINSENE